MKENKRKRFGIYARYSSEMQNEMSIEAQIARCKEEIGKRGGVVVDTFVDEAKSGWSLDRPGFEDFKLAASRGKFDAAMFWKFDRLARDSQHATVIKMLLRRDYGITLHCVEGFSEDDDSPMGAMMEEIIGVVSAYYSRNLSSETKRGKHYRASNGAFNGSVPPIGYDLVTASMSTDELPAGLYVNPDLAEIVLTAFEMYASGKHSDRDVADWLNQQKAIVALRENKKPVGKEMVRDMLQNRTYTGRVSYSDTQYSGTLGQGKKSSRGRKKWFEGKHEAIISDELFERCQSVRQKNTKYRKTESTMRTYLLHDRVYCARCIAHKPSGLADDNYGKMRPTWMERDRLGYYRCISHQRGYERCGQKYMRVDELDDQVMQALFSLHIPQGFRDRVEAAVRNRIENEQALKRIAELEEIIQRMDFRWDQGLLTSKEEFLEKRRQLQHEVDALRPIDYDNLMEAADLIENFQTYWDKCERLDSPEQGRQQLLQKIIDMTLKLSVSRSMGILA